VTPRLLSLLSGVEFSWLDAIDILIVAFISYQLLQFLRGTHAVQAAIGAVLLVLLYWASVLANLQTLNWLLRTFLPFLVFGIIVVFQSEIRKVLSSLGKTPFFGLGSGSTTRRGQEEIDEVVLAATTLSGQRTGAIVVIEREMGLRSYVETGIPLDAVLTYDLLISVFSPGTPLHDGAAIIQNGRIAAAACFLPLTVNPTLSRALGSRHRAAIGLCEDTDAIAVVVSEETGTISLVYDGRIHRDFDSTSLRSALLAAMGVRRPAAETEASVGLAAVRRGDD
jgi:diadenylate cyclase